MKKIFSVCLFLLVSAIIFAQSKMSPNTRHLVSTMKQSGLSEINAKNKLRNYVVRNIGDEQYINAYIHLSDGNNGYEILEEYGVKINSKFPGIITASIPVKNLEAVSGLKEVKYIQAGIPVYQLMDKARVSGQVDNVQEGLKLPAPFWGSGVVVGIIDTGFEYGHPNFYNFDKTDLRIKRVWNQNGKQGLPPKNFSYGTELATKDKILIAAFDGSQTHGSHVAGIAAGGDTLDNAFYGIAGDAEIVLVSMNTTEADPDMVNISDGIKYIYDYAESVGKPCVVNMSLGSHMGPHDGTSTFDVLADAMQGKGRLLVGAAGNEGSDNFHISKTFNEAEDIDSLSSFISFTSGRPYSTVDIWGDKGMKYSIQLLVYDRGKRVVKKYYDVFDASSAEGNEKTYSMTVAKDGATGTVQIITEISPLNNKPHATIFTELSGIQNYYSLGFTIKKLGGGTVHAWADDIYSELTNNAIPGYTKGDSKCSVGEIGGTGKRIITAGAYSSKNNYKDEKGTTRTTSETLNQIASFSSLGPTPDGRIKPDITAPGSTLASSISSNDINLRGRIIANKKSWKSVTYYYGMMDGTSMSSPFVAGVLATWLQANNEISPEDVRAILKTTSIKDSFTGILPEEGDNTWGYGKINAWEGIKEALRMNPQSINSETLPEVIAITSGNHGVNLLFTSGCSDANISVFDLNGKMVHSMKLSEIKAGDEIPVTPAGIGKGIYVVKVSGSQLSFTSKLTVR